jgi:hypothetical protein
MNGRPILGSGETVWNGSLWVFAAENPRSGHSGARSTRRPMKAMLQQPLMLVLIGFAQSQSLSFVVDDPTSCRLFEQPTRVR